MGWKPNPKGANAKDLKDQNMELWTLEAHEFIQAHWSRASKGYELKVFTRTMGIVQLDGFEQDVRTLSLILLKSVNGQCKLTTNLGS